MKTSICKPALWLSVFAFTFFQQLQAQNQIAGTIRDAAGKPLPFASVLLLSAADSALLRGLIATEQGAYSFENVPAGNFLLSFSMLGYEQVFSKIVELTDQAGHTDLEAIVLPETSAAIGEALVVARRPFLEQKIDRTVVNVANSITNAGSNALEVLQRSPGVQVNALTKAISLMGKEGVVIMINGKIARQPADAIVQMLAGMSSDNIDRIELIHTPPASFEAEGNAGVINIILKSTGDEGFNGGYSAKAGYGKGAKYGAGANFNYRNALANWFGAYSYDFNMNPQVFTNYRGLRQGNDFLETESYSNRWNTPTSVQNARIGADFQLSPKTIVGVLGTFFDRNWYMDATNSVTYSRNGAIDSRLQMPVTETNQHRSLTGNINLSHQFSPNQSLNVDADYIAYDIHNPSHYTVRSLDAANAPESEYELRIAKKTPIRMAVAKADYAVNFGENLKMETGAKFTSMRFTNDVCVERREQPQAWMTISDLTSIFHLNEAIAGAYTTFSYKAGAKTDVKAGLRYEFAHTNLGSAEQPDVVNRRYGSWFPSLFVTRKLGENQDINFSYSRRITRPQISRLAPWLIFSDPTTLEGGNPALQPSFTNALKLDYGFKSVRFGLSYSIENDPMRFLPHIDPQTNRQINRPENLDRQKVMGANLHVPFHPASWWEMQNNLYVNATEIRFELDGQKLRLNNVNYGFSTNQTFTLPERFMLEISGNYDSPGYWGVALWKATGSLNVGIQKDFGQKWGKLRFAASDLFVSSNWFGQTNQPELNLLVKSSYQFSERTFVLSWTNTFGNNKLKSARQRQTGSAEELKRI